MKRYWSLEKKSIDDIVGQTVVRAGLLLLSIPDINRTLQECNQGKDILKEIEVPVDGETRIFPCKVCSQHP